jgi:hypothetical protein
MKAMVSHLIGVLFSFGLVTTAPADTDATSANYYLRGCRAVVSDSKTYEDAGELFMSGACLGVVSTLMDKLSPTDPFMRALLPQPQPQPQPQLVCIPDGVTNRQAVAVVVKFLDDHPNQLHQRFIVLAQDALYEAWPCPLPAKP